MAEVSSKGAWGFSASSDIGDLARRLVRVAPILDKSLGYMEAFAELFSDMMPLTEHAMDVATDRLVTLDQKGYFTFGRALAVVLILETVKEMTHPEIMAVLYRMIEAVQRQQQQLEQEPAEPPSMFSLLKRMRNPEIRRGLGRALNTLSAVSDVDTGPPRKFVVVKDQEQEEVDNSTGGK